MKCRWRMLTGLGLMLVAGACLPHPAIHWRLIGWARGDAFYQGRPTLWWARQIEGKYEPAIDPKPGDAGWASMEPPSWAQWFGDLTSSPRRTTRNARMKPPLTTGEPAALPVLLELVERPEAKVRRVAIACLGVLDDESVLRLLHRMLSEADEGVRVEAEDALRRRAERARERP